MNINKTLKITQKIIRIFKVLLVLSIVVYTLLILYSGNIDTTQTAATSISLGMIELNLRQTFQDSVLSPALLFITLFIMISLLILWYLMLSKLDIIIANAISGQIFSPTSGRSLKMISVYVIIEGVFSYSSISPGWQSSASQIASRVEKRIAEIFPVLSFDRLTLVIPTFSESSLSDIFLSAMTLSSLNIIFPITIKSHHLVSAALRHRRIFWLI